MKSAEIFPAFIIALISIAIGFLLFRYLFDLNTLKLKPRFHGTRQRTREWFRVHARKIALIVVAAIVAIILVYSAIRFAGPLIKAISTLIYRPAAPEPAAQAAPLPVEEPTPAAPAAIVADHRIVDEVRLDRLTQTAVEQAKARLHIYFVHGTHGSQLTYGLKGLAAFKGPIYGGLDIESLEFGDRSEPDLQGWSDRVRSYLDDPANRDINVVMWSWSNELSSATEQTVADYLQLTGDLETEHPGVHFVYMTGHEDGSGPNGNLRKRNEQIRAYCLGHGKILYDFADIESHDPDGNYYGDKSVNDGCWYDSDANGSLDRNWAREWSEANPGKWYDCYTAHSFPLNANLKAYAAWWLWARLAEEKPFGEGN
jgi:hypothetical protein